MKEVSDRIFSTSVDLLYTFAPFEITAPKDEKRLDFEREQIAGASGLEAWEGTKVSERAREITLSVFATDESASVQVRLRLFAVVVVVVLGNDDWDAGDVVQDGAADDQRDGDGGSGDIHASEQTLHPGRHEIHRNRQHISVSVSSSFLGKRQPG